MSARHTGARVGLIALGVAAGLGLGEVLLRAIGYEGANERAVVDFDNDYGDIPRDSWPFRLEIRPGGEIEMAERRYPVDRTPGVFRFLFVGDSGTAGSGVSTVHAFPAAFERIHASVGGPPIEAINSGIPGLSTVGELRLLEERLLVLEPDVVVLGVFMANDIQFNVERVRAYRSPTVGWLRQRSALAHALYLRWMALSPALGLGRPGSAWTPTTVEEHGISMSEYVPGEVATYIAPPTPTLRFAFDLMEETLRRIRDLGRDHGFALAVVLIPTLSSLTGELRFPDPRDTSSWNAFELRPGETIDVEQPTREVLAMCARLELLCVDPTPRLASDLGADAILVNDDHPTEAAHQIIAQAIHARLWIEGPPYLPRGVRRE